MKRPESKQPMPPRAKRVFKGVIFDVYQWEQEMFDGSTAVFEKLKRDDVAVIIPVLEDGRILLIEEEQPGEEIGLHIPAGRLEGGESPEEGAARELLEETGHEADGFYLWDAFQVTTKIDWVVYVFIARGSRRVAEQRLDPGERISLRPVTFEVFIDLAIEHGFLDGKLLRTLMEAKYEPANMAALRKLFSGN